MDASARSLPGGHAGEPPETRCRFAGEYGWPGETSVGDAICDSAIAFVETLADLAYCQNTCVVQNADALNRLHQHGGIPSSLFSCESPMAAAACFGPSPLPGETKSGRLLRGLQSAASSLLRATPTNGWDRSHACANIVVRTPPTRGGRTGIALWLRTATPFGRCFSGD